MTNKIRKTAKAAGMSAKMTKQMKTLTISSGRDPNLRSRVLKQSPQFPSGVSAMSRKCVTIEEDEYIADIASTTAFTNTQFPLNPGQLLTFPWLSKLAANWEKYRFNNIEFYYKPEASAYATAGQTGKVILSFDYDAADAAPTSKTMCEDTDPHVDCMPYEECILKLDCKYVNDTLTGKYVRPGGVPGGTDIRLYDGGNLNVSTYGTASGGTCGEIRVRYSVTLEKPIIEPATPISNNYSVAHFQSTTTEASGASTVAAQLLFATSVVNGLGIVNTAGSFALPLGNYLVIVRNEIVNSGPELTSWALDLLRNGTTTVPVGSLSQSITAGGNQTSANTGDLTFFIQSSSSANGYTVSATNSYVNGSTTNAGQIIFVAI
jgi:hypothetical protein